MENALYKAAYKGDIKGMADILNTGFDVDTPGTSVLGRFPAIIAATMANQYEAVEFLIMRGASIQPENTILNYSPLRAAQEKNVSTDLTKLLLAQNAIADCPRLNEDRVFSYKPLFVAVKNKRVENIKLLLEAQADCTLAEEGTHSPLSYAKEQLPSLLPLFEPYLKKNKKI